MRVVIAPDSFKGSLTAVQVCAALASGLRRADPALEVDQAPLADGGDGTAEVLVAATSGWLEEVTVTGPLGEPVSARFGLLGDQRTAVIEMAQASGLTLVPERRRNPLVTGTFGTGELILAALDAGCREFLIGIGGSATTDAGAGMARALGVCFLDEQGGALDWPSGGALRRLRRLDVTGLDPRVRESRFRVACDVTNPLYGPSGAAHVYAPQKGATPEMVEELDLGLRQFAAVVHRDLGLDIAALPGAGAAGGLGAGLVAFCGATLEPGAQVVLEVIRFRERLLGAGLVITGEGRLDRQTAFGKLPWAVAQVAGEAGVPVVAVAGRVDCPPEELAAWGLQAAFAACQGPRSLEEAMRPEVATASLENLAWNLLRLLSLGSR